MDHLQTSEERKDRWYAKHLTPNYVATKPAETWEDLWDETGLSYGANNSNVRSLPFEWVGNADTPENDENLSLSQRIQKALQCHGFLVVAGVLSDRECEQSLEEAWDWMEAASEAERFFPVNKEKITIPPNVSQQSPVHRSDPSTLESIYFPRSVEGGMLPFYGSGHSQFAWTIRSHANVRRVFEALHGTDNLVSSLDGIVLWRGGNNVRWSRVGSISTLPFAREISTSSTLYSFLGSFAQIQGGSIWTKTHTTNPTRNVFKDWLIYCHPALRRVGMS